MTILKCLPRIGQATFVASLACLMTGAPVKAQNVVKIGQIEAQTGPFAAYGYMLTRGAAMAVDEINRAGGFTVGSQNYKLELVSPDTRGDPKEGVVLAKKLVELDKAKIIFGPSTSNVFSVVFPYFQRLNGQVLQLPQASRAHEQLGKPGNEFLIRTWNWVDGPKGSGTLLTKYVVDKLKPKKMGMLLPNHEGGRVTAEVLTIVFKNVNLPFATEYYDPTTKDYTPMLGKLASAGADVLVPPPGSDEAALTDVIRQAAEGNYFRRVVAYNGGTLNPGLRNKDIVDDYVYDSSKYFPEAEKNDPKIKSFIERYKAFHKEEFPYSQAPTCASSCYDMVFMVVEAMKKAGSVDDLPAIRKALLGSKYEGLWKYAFDEKGELMFDFEVVHLTRGGTIKTEAVVVAQ